MSKEAMKHTPGPWEAELKTYPIMVRSQTETWPLVDENGNEEGRAGAFVCNTGDNKANARLIAAAPDLLEALQQATSALEWRWERVANRAAPVHETAIQEAYDQARAAIAKATGGEV